MSVRGWSVQLFMWCGGLVLPLGASAQSADVEQVQAVVIGLRSPQQALQADRHLSGIPGVQLTRTDMHTSNLFMLVDAASPDQESAVRSSLSSLGLRLACWRRSPRSDAPFRHLDPDQCQETPSVK